MDLSVPEDPKEIAKVLTDIRYLIKDVILPEMLRQQDEIRKLREITWPVCQSLREKSQLTDMDNKKKFLKDFQKEEIINLIKQKSKFSASSDLSPSTFNLTREELSKLNLN